MYKKEWVSGQRTDVALKEMKSNEEPSTGVEALYIGLWQSHVHIAYI